MERVTIVKDALMREINQEMALSSACRGLHALDVVRDPARVQGANWKMQGFRRSGHGHDEAECQVSIAEFMADMQERFDIGE